MIYTSIVMDKLDKSRFALFVSSAYCFAVNMFLKNSFFQQKLRVKSGPTETCLRPAAPSASPS